MLCAVGLFGPSHRHGTMASADFLQFVVTAALAVCKTSRDKSSIFPRLPAGFTCMGYDHHFGLRDIWPTYPPYRPWYPISVRQATISLLLLLAHASRLEPCKSLWGSLVATPLVDFHHRLTACPSYHKNRGFEPLLMICREDPPAGQQSSCTAYQKVCVVTACLSGGRCLRRF